MAIRTVIVDDEPLARQGIRALLEGESDCEIQSEAADGPEAVRAIRTLKPDLLFLDVQIPGFDGFEVLRRSAGTHLPAVVFVTAHDEYACRAFEANAIDYLLKPVGRDRLSRAMQRLRRELVHEEVLSTVQHRLAAFIDMYQRPTTPGGVRRDFARWFTVKDGNAFRVIRTEEIARITSASNYIELHAQGRTFLVRTTMNQVEDSLDPQQFVRVHRSVIVNFSLVDVIDHSAHGELVVKLRDGTVVPLGRAYRDRVVR